MGLGNYYDSFNKGNRFVFKLNFNTNKRKSSGKTLIPKFNCDS